MHDLQAAAHTTHAALLLPAGFVNNRMSGALPASFTFNSSNELRELSVGGNNFTGQVPSWPDQPGASLSIRPGNEGLCGLVSGNRISRRLPPLRGAIGLLTGSVGHSAPAHHSALLCTVSMGRSLRAPISLPSLALTTSSRACRRALRTRPAPATLEGSAAAQLLGSWSVQWPASHVSDACCVDAPPHPCCVHAPPRPIHALLVAS